MQIDKKLGSDKRRYNFKPLKHSEYYHEFLLDLVSWIEAIDEWDYSIA